MNHQGVRGIIQDGVIHTDQLSRLCPNCLILSTVRCCYISPYGRTCTALMEVTKRYCAIFTPLQSAHTRWWGSPLSGRYAVWVHLQVVPILCTWTTVGLWSRWILILNVSRVLSTANAIPFALNMVIGCTCPLRYLSENCWVGDFIKQAYFWYANGDEPRRWPGVSHRYAW